MPSYPHIERYRAELAELIEFGGSDNEQSIRAAFQGCLAAYCRDHRERLLLVPELALGSGLTETGIRPDGTVKDALRMARGYWEAKDTHDDLDAEIQAKFNRGYPRDNIVFEDSETAVLFQNGAVAMRVDMTRAGELHRLISRFLDYELPEIGEFRQARQQFKADLPAVLENLRETVGEAEAGNPEYRVAADAFLELCRKSISPDVSDADVREMLLQHILTKDIFLRVFAEDQFHRENNVARQLDALERTFFTGDVRREAIDRLRAYYGVIGRAADEIADYAEKQQFLKAIYEDFYQAYNPAAADRLGVVYTPNEVVDFIIRGTDWLLRKHFGKTLADDNVQILDPATGTGTFITNLINHLPLERLERKYLHEVHANEVAILPYYIANLNIEYTYRERTGEYLEFPNLCFVDTLDNMDWQGAGASGGAVQRQGAFNLGTLSEENWIRVQEQNEKPISVIIGNPPYNDSATLWGDGGANREYQAIDQRIRETYIASGTAQRTHQYDMYKRFVRWASDRLADDGIIGFVSNSAFLDARQDDGFRKVVAEEFNELWAVDLKGNARTSGERRRQEGGNVFDDKIRVGVAVYFLVRSKGLNGFKVFYNAVDDYAKASEKVEFIKGKAINAFEYREIAPNVKAEWLNQSDSNFEQLLPLANRETKFAKTAADERSVFGLFTNAIKSNRDDWVYDFEIPNLRNKALFFTDEYNGFLDAGDQSYDPVIKWSSTLRDRFQRGERIIYNDGSRLELFYRPFVAKWHFADIALNDRLTRNHYEMFGPDLKQPNKVINFCVNGKAFYVLAADRPTDFHFTGDTQCLPLYRYTADGERVSNITEWGRRQFREHYGDESITDEDIFAYVYAMLHDPAYRQRYEIDLRREFPRVYFQTEFAEFARLGRELLDLHLGFETVEPWPLERVEATLSPRPSPIEGEGAGPSTGSGRAGASPRVILRADKERGIIRLDEQTTLAGVPWQAWVYELGSRSAVEWVLDQYKERKPRDPTIRERFNTYRFADHKERVIDLLARVCTVSVKTMEIVDLKIDVLTDIDPDEGLELRPEVLVELLEYEQEVQAAGRSVMPDEDFARLKEDLKERGLYP
ncbi:MAG: N-6 DNA methylase [Chloroflexi bacterium]|nr:N-6 DNA methylase [Chloroflexota bacterium]